MNYYIDCGINLGQGVRALHKTLKFDDSWNYYGFEPLKGCYDKIDTWKDDLPFRSFTAYNKAVWTRDDKVEFASCTPVRHLNNITTENTTYGGSFIVETGNQYEKSYDNKHHGRVTSKALVECICLWQWIEQTLPAKTSASKTVVKMDIEGAEYEVLRSLLDSNTAQNYIDEMYIEFHSRFFDFGTERDRELIRNLEDQNVVVHDWH